jgi:hypothetical protein
MTPLIRMRSVSFWTFCVMEYRAVARSRDVLGILFGGILMYAVLYNYMYSREVVRGQCVAVVDEDFTAASRMFVRRLSATPQWASVCRSPPCPMPARPCSRGG